MKKVLFIPQHDESDCGVAASAVTSEGVDWLFDKLEEKIWGEAK